MTTLGSYSSIFVKPINQEYKGLKINYSTCQGI